MSPAGGAPPWADGPPPWLPRSRFDRQEGGFPPWTARDVAVTMGLVAVGVGIWCSGVAATRTGTTTTPT